MKKELGRPLDKDKETILSKGMTKNRKIAAAKYLRDTEGMTYSKIGEWLGISDDSAERYVKVYELPEEDLVVFQESFAGIMRLMSLEGMGKVNKRLLELIPNERKISEVVKAGEYYGGRAKSEAPNIQVNIANILDKEREEYTLVDN